MFGRTEDAIDEAKRLRACGLADQAAKLRLAEIGIGDDNDAEPVGPCGAHQLDGRLETIAMVSLGNELLLDRLGDLLLAGSGAPPVIDFLDRDFVAALAELR